MDTNIYVLLIDYDDLRHPIMAFHTEKLATDYIDNFARRIGNLADMEDELYDDLCDEWDKILDLTPYHHIDFLNYDRFFEIKKIFSIEKIELIKEGE
jgi:hypothetical protein